MGSPPPEVAVAPPRAAPVGTAFFRLWYLGISAELALAYVGVTWVYGVRLLELPLGFLVLFFIPGYALGAILLGERPQLPWSALFAFTVGLSVVANVLVGLVLTIGAAGLPPRVFSAFAFSITLLAIVVSLERGTKLEAPSAWSAAKRELSLPGFSSGQRAVAYALLLSILVVLSGIFYLSTVHPNEKSDVSFGIFGPGGLVTSLPTAGSVGEILTVTGTISNNNTAQLFELVVKSALNGTNQTTFTPIPWTQPLPLGVGVESSLPLNLNPAESVSENVSFTYSQAGVYTVTFALEGQGVTIRSVVISLTIV